MLKNDTQAVRSFGDLVHNTLLEKGKTARSIGLSAEKDEDRTAGLVVRVVEPVPQVEGLVAVRFVPSLVMEEVDWHGDVVLWVQQRGVCVFAFGEASLCLGSLYLAVCKLCLLWNRSLLDNGVCSSSFGMRDN